MGTKKQKLIPPDPERCQAQILEGSFMTLGPRSYIRCKTKPSVVIQEKQPGKDGQRGAMSLCPDCLQVYKKKADIKQVEVIEVSKWKTT